MGCPCQEVALARANLAYEQGLYEEALGLFSDFIKNYPQSHALGAGVFGTRECLLFVEKI